MSRTMRVKTTLIPAACILLLTIGWQNLYSMGELENSNPTPCNRGNTPKSSVVPRTPVFQTLSPDFEYHATRCILKDRMGFMWFGTSDGLVRYDGTRLFLYHRQEGLNHGVANAIAEDNHRNLWVGTAVGLNLYNRDRDRFVRLESSDTSYMRLNYNYVSALFVEKDSILWVGTYGDGVNIFNYISGEITNLPYDPYNPNALSSNRVSSIQADSQGNIWVGTTDGLSLFQGYEKGFRHFHFESHNSKSISNSHITSLALDCMGQLWVGTQGGGVNKLVNNDGDLYFQSFSTENSQISTNYIHTLYADRNGFLWIGTDNGGLNKLNLTTESFEVFTREEGNKYSISSNSIWSIHGDDEDRIWLGTYNRGVNIIDDRFQKFELLQRNSMSSNTLPANDITSFAEDSRGNIWVATDGGGLARFNPTERRFNRFINSSTPNNPLTNNAVSAIILDQNNDLWVGTWAGGIDRYNKHGKKLKNYTFLNNQESTANNVFGLYIDSNRRLWALTAGKGLFLFNRKNDKFEQLYFCPHLDILTSSTYVTCMMDDGEGTLWIGTLNGLVLLTIEDDNQYSCDYSIFEGRRISSPRVEVIFRDSKKRIWVGTPDNGLNLFQEHDSTFVFFREEDGLPSNSIKGILEDDSGNLWVSTNRGLARFNPTTQNFSNFTKEDGINSNQLYARSCLRASTGELYFGGTNGFNVFNPETIKKNPYPPKVYLSDLWVNNRRTSVGGSNSPLAKHISVTTGIELNHLQSSFSIDFVALNYTQPLKNQFKYMLEGFDTNWVDANYSNSATYTNIPPGSYVFKVMGSNNDGVWNETPTELLITIKPPLWKTWWAYIIYASLLTLAILGSLKIWKGKIEMRNQLKLEQLAREKEHELNEQNIQFFTTISHEFRTPLSLIIAPLEKLLSKTTTRNKEQLQVMYKNAEKLEQLTNNLLDIRKLEDGAMKLKVFNGEVVGFVRNIASYFDASPMAKQIEFTIEIDKEHIQGWFDAEKLETVIANLLSNAFKFTPANGSVKLKLSELKGEEVAAKYNQQQEIRLDSHYLELVVEDSGIGIGTDELPHIFDKFYRSKTKHIKKCVGTGIGLALVKGLVEMHYGFITVSSSAEEGSKFTVLLPTSQNAFLENETSQESMDAFKRDDERIPCLEKVSSNEDENGERTDHCHEVLVVEDNDEFRSFLVKELSSCFKVLQASDGRVGFEIARTAIPDLIISDVMMPECSGTELCKFIKTDLLTCHIPVILLTAKSTVDEQIKGIETGADAYIIKPFSYQLLLTHIKQLIESRKKLYAHFSQEVYIMPNKMAKVEIDQKFLQKIIDYIIENIGDNSLTIDGLANSLNMSHSNLYRKIKALTGKSITEFIKLIRLKEAIKLMETNKYTITEVAYHTGFTSPSYFTKCFRSQYGKPPSEFMPN